MNNRRLTELLSTIRAALVSTVPDIVRGLTSQSPAYCLFIWYQDLSTDDYTLELGLATTELRDACLSGQYVSQLGNNAKTSIWLPQQSIAKPFPGFPISTHLCKDLSAEANECYAILTNDESMDGEEGEVLRPIRVALQKAARELNSREWSDRSSYTDDFVVLAADYVGYWIVEDMQASIPKQKLATLNARGLIPAEWLQDNAAILKARFEAEEAAAKQARQSQVEAQLRDAEQTHQRKLQEGGACPKCGFASGWDGTKCSHCRYGQT